MNPRCFPAIPRDVAAESDSELQIKNLETQVHDILRFLRSLQNTLRPINRLPPEIVSYIARSVFEDNDIDTRSIVPLTHVCRYWRDSIISMPENWTLISNKRRKLAELSLARAKAAPLTITLNLLESNQGLLDLLPPYIPNVASLTCDGFYTIEDLIQALPNLPGSMPKLRSLDLRKTIHANWNRSIDPFDFSAHTKLRELSLTSIPLFPSILRIRTLTEFSLIDYFFPLHIDTLLSFLEENHSLEDATFDIEFTEHSLCRSRRRTPVGNGLRRLSIFCEDTIIIRALISSIALRKGAALEIHHYGNDTKLSDILSGVPATHLPNLSSSTFMEYQTSLSLRSIRLLGPDGSFLYEGGGKKEALFGEFPLLPLVSVREFHLSYRSSWSQTRLQLSSFPSLEVLVVDCGVDNTPLFISLPNPASSPFMKTLVFLDCVITKGFMIELSQLAAYRKKTASASLRRVVIANSPGNQLPGVALVDRLKKHVPVVEVAEGRELPEDLR